MYYLHPIPEWTAFRRVAKPRQKLDANNQGMVERFPCQGQPARPLLDFPILPDTVSAFLFTWINHRLNTSYRSTAQRSYGGLSYGGVWILV